MSTHDFNKASKTSQRPDVMAFPLLSTPALERQKQESFISKALKFLSQEKKNSLSSEQPMSPKASVPDAQTRKQQLIYLPI